MATPTVQSLQADVQKLQSQVAALSTTTKQASNLGVQWPFSAPLKKQLNNQITNYFTPVVIPYMATTVPDVASGDFFSMILTGNLTLSNPINGAEGQRMIFEFVQDGTGSRTLTLGSGFKFGTGVTGVTLTTTANKRDFMGCLWRHGNAYVVAFAPGY